MIYSVTSLISAHLAILYVLFIPGILITLVLMRFFREARTLIDGYDLLIIFALLFSIPLNGVIVFLFTKLNISYDQYATIIGLIDLCLIIILFYKNTKFHQFCISSSNRTVSNFLFTFSFLFFVIMLVNGGLIDMLADSWWHMSYANRIAESSNYVLERNHLTGEPVISMVYIPLWHIQLALIKHVSGEELPYIWHTLAPWLVVLSIFSYYRLSSVLIRSKWGPFVSVIFFTLLLGGLNSYLRVSPWPGNVSYIFWYLLIYLTFRYIDFQPTRQSSGPISIFETEQYASLFKGIWQNRFLVSILVLTVLVIAGLHRAQLLWYLTGFLTYFLFIRHANKNSFISNNHIDKDYSVLLPIVSLFAVMLLAAELYLLDSFSVKEFINNPVKYTSIAIMLTSIWIYSRLMNLTVSNDKCWRILLAIAAFVSLYFVIDWVHLYGLFVKSAEVSSNYRHIPRIFEGPFPGLTLKLPSWSHQLRWGLLYSGVLAVPVAIYLVIMRRDRGSYFLASCAIIGFLGITSPYYFSALIQVIPYNSMYRIHMMIFTPIIFALLFNHAWDVIRRDDQA